MVVFAVQILFIFNFFYSMYKGRKVTSQNPWEATTLEWTTPINPGHGNWIGEIPEVHRCKTFTSQISTIVREETNVWVQEFQNTIKTLDESIKAQPAVVEPGALNLTITNADQGLELQRSSIFVEKKYPHDFYDFFRSRTLETACSTPKGVVKTFWKLFLLQIFDSAGVISHQFFNP